MIEAWRVEPMKGTLIYGSWVIVAVVTTIVV